MAKPGPDPSVPTEKFLVVLHDAYPPALGTGDIADAVDLSTQGANKHLERLKKDELLDCTLVGNTKIWWLTDKGKKRVSAHSRENQ